MAHGEVITQGSHQQAKEAIRNKDYETAIANYKILAAEGDPEASLKLGRIYELQGDSGAAYHAYKQAAERIRWLDRKGVTGDEEIDQANQRMEEPSQISGASTAKNTNSLQYKPVTASSQLGAKPPVKPAYHIQSIEQRVVKVTLERISNIQHFKPEKFLRVPKSKNLKTQLTSSLIIPPLRSVQMRSDYQSSLADESSAINILFNLCTNPAGSSNSPPSLSNA